MSIIPCEQNAELREKIEEFADQLKTQAHTLGNHGLTEQEFYNEGLFRGAIERVRGQFSSTMKEKREFVANVLDHMQAKGFLREWGSAGESNRHDYSVTLDTGRTAIIELKGCLDGNNTNIFERPPHAEEFVIWSVCTNPGADPQHNAWSGIHTRLSAEIIYREQLVDGLIVWDMYCNSLGRPCPKLNVKNRQVNQISDYTLPPPCVYVLPGTIPSPRNNPHPPPRQLADVQLIQAFHECFGGTDDEVNYVDFQVEYRGSDLMRTTCVKRNGIEQKKSKPTAIRRS